eukprot:TRINITY_DN880_c0_g9_i1.p1 TRINITY_DN880_c0_g9~~TRINITY_DN880_c0_g9_i1.p1  ORF type:complete len:438 (+),score=67.11 TRINITY_DN880_c0_g9_i1:143-1456(+)
MSGKLPEMPLCEQISDLIATNGDRLDSERLLTSGGGKDDAEWGRASSADLVLKEDNGFEIWLGSLEDALNLGALRKFRINAVVNCALEDCRLECACYRVHNHNASTPGGRSAVNAFSSNSGTPTGSPRVGRRRGLAHCETYAEFDPVGSPTASSPSSSPASVRPGSPFDGAATSSPATCAASSASQALSSSGAVGGLRGGGRPRSLAHCGTYGSGGSLVDQRFLGQADSMGSIKELSGSLERSPSRQRARTLGDAFYPEDIRAAAEFDGRWYSEVLAKEVAYLGIAARDADGYPMSTHFAEVITFLEGCRRAGRRVLVHCVMGINRSAAAVVAFLCTSQGEAGRLQLLEAIDLVSRRRGHVLSNSSFVHQLIDTYATPSQALVPTSPNALAAATAAPRAKALASAAGSPSCCGGLAARGWPCQRWRLSSQRTSDANP